MLVYGYFLRPPHDADQVSVATGRGVLSILSFKDGLPQQGKKRLLGAISIFLGPQDVGHADVATGRGELSRPSFRALSLF
jgi:hypothetical protein